MRVLITAATRQGATGEIAQVIGRNNQLINQLWIETVAAWPTIRGMDFSSFSAIMASGAPGWPIGCGGRGF